jgi:RNA polymerase sigma-70 factor (ECF subfamily)
VTDVRRPEDDVLVAGALRGDEEALGRLLARDQEWAYNVAYRVLGQEADARDAVQDAFLQTVRAIRGEGSPPRSIESYRPWLRRVVSNAAITQIRRRPAVPVASVDALPDAPSGDTRGEPGHAIEREETRTRVLQALLSLPESQRVALALRELLDAPYDEIAEALDLPRTAVGTLLFRARAGFRAAYDRVPATAPPLDCPDLVPLFAAIVDDEPRPAAWQDLEEHLRACDRCQGDLEGQRRSRRAYALLPLLAVPAGWEPAKAALAGLIDGAASGGAASGAAAAGSVAGGVAGAAGGEPAAGGAATAGQSASAGVGSAASGGAGVAAGSTGAVTGAVGSTSGGLLAAGLGAKLTVAALATAAVVGTAVVAGPLAGPSPGPTTLPSPTPLVAGAPASAPGPAAPPAPGSVGSTPSEPISSGAAASASPPVDGVGAVAAASPAVAVSPGPSPAPQASPSAQAPAPVLPPPSPTALTTPTAP